MHACVRHACACAYQVLTREDASLVTKAFILDEFMDGFLYKLFVQKWAKFGWYLHLILRSLDAAVIALTLYAASAKPQLTQRVCMPRHTCTRAHVRTCAHIHTCAHMHACAHVHT